MTLVDVVREHSRLHGEKRAVVFLAPGQAPRVRSYAELDVEARALATLLCGEGHSGRPVILSAPPGVEFVAGFLACLYAGAIAVPAYPARNERQVQHLRALCAATDARCILLTSTQLAAHDALVSPVCPDLRPLSVDRVDASLAAAYREPRQGTDTAFLQYTSGSTAQPKGVVVTHENLLANQAMIARAFRHDAALVAAGWLPPYHDMGLIGSILQPLYIGGTAVLMSPSSFIRDPGMWLRAVSEYRATTSGGPNFGYDLCADAVGPEQCHGLDLSHWNVAFTGAEPIRQRTLERFRDRFAGVGFSPAAFQPCYGLAEATLLVTSGVVGRAPTVIELDAEPSPTAPAGGGNGGSGATVRRQVVGCGFAPSDGNVLIVDPEKGTRCLDGQPGEVWVSGPHVARGYWREPEKSAGVFEARVVDFPEQRFLRTGDIGFVHEGELFVTGRIKDIVIVRGRNAHAEDIEWCVSGAHPALRAGRVAAFSIDDGTAARIVLVHEIDASSAGAASDVLQLLRERVMEGTGVALDEVALVRPGTVPMTSSGKVRRKACAERYAAGRLEVMAAWTAPSEAAGDVGSVAIVDEASVHEWLEVSIASLARASTAAVDPHQTLARLGLDSMAGVRLAHEVRSAFGVELSAADVSAESTPAILAREILRRRTPAARVSPPEPPASERFRASWAQRGVWLADRQAPSAGLYSLSATFDIEGVDTSTLRAGFERIMARHEVLRSVFRVSDGELWQQILPEPPAGWWSCTELGGASDRELAGGAGSPLDAPFDIERGPLVRVQVRRFTTGIHRVALAAHHLVADQWSLALVLDELLSGPSRQAKGQARSHGAPSPFSEYVAEERAYLETPAAQAGLRRWRERGRGTARSLTLRTRGPSHDEARSQGGRFRSRLSPHASARLREFAAAHGSTPYCVILAAFHATLARLSELPEVAVGTATNGRVSGRFAGTVGYFVNPIVTFSSSADEAGFVALLRSITAAVTQGIDDARWPLAALAAARSPEQPGAGPALFDAFLSYHTGAGVHALAAAAAMDAPGVVFERGGVRVTSVSTGAGPAQFGLHLCAAELGDEFHFDMRHDATRCSPSAARQVLQCALVLLEQVLVGSPSSGIAALPRDDQRTIDAVNQTCVRREGPSLLHEWVERSVRAWPERRAVCFEQESLDYAQLDARAKQLARRLTALGAGPEVPVAVYLERSLELVVALLGVLQSGSFYVPLDPDHPTARTEQLLADLGRPLVITSRALQPRVPLAACRGVVLEPEAAAQTTQNTPGDPLAPLGSGKSPAYLIYTSGSTGKPKGVVNVHSAIVNRLCWMQDRLLQLTPDDNVLQKTPTTFDVSVWEFFAPLLAGARLTLARPGVHRNPTELAALIQSSGITVAHFVPSMLERFLAEPSAARCVSLRCVISSGEALSPALSRRFHQLLGGHARLHNLYGPTEAAIDVTHFECGPDETTVPIGRPIDNVRTHVLDRKGRPVPIGFEGELFLAGVGLARGYWRAPALTAAAFVPDAFADQPGARAYRTGDIVRWASDGNLEFVGRRDDQIKLFGHRVELGEIESVLVGAAGVRSAAVAARELDGQPLLVAYLVLDAPGPLVEAELRRFLADRLPRHMVPSRFVPVEALPLNPGGKLDRSALPPLAPCAPLPRPEPSATPLQRCVAALWAEALHIEHVGVEQDFFELGGQSIVAMQLVMRLQAEFATPVPLLTSFFEDPTVGGMATALSESGSIDGSGLDACFERVRRALREDARLWESPGS